MSLNGRVALITGASRGIGRSIALRLAREGVHVVAAAKTESTDQTQFGGTIHETAADCTALGPEALAVRCDVRDDTQIAAAVGAAVQRFGRLDMAIHNAGVLWWKPVLDTPLKRFDLLMGVNARAAHALAFHAIPHLKAAGGGHFITMSPPVFADHLGGKAAYLVSKFGMTLLAQGVAEEHRDDRISACALWPETGIESAATIHFGLGTPAMWYKPELVADALYEIVRHDDLRYSGKALLAMETLREAGMNDFTPYRCDPDFEPPPLLAAELPRAGGTERVLPKAPAMPV